MTTLLRQKPSFNIAAALLFFAVAGIAPKSEAHQQWLAPNFFVESADSAWVSFDHTFSDRRFQPGSAPSSYYQWWSVGPDGVKRSIPFLFLGKTRTVGELEIDAPGTYRLEGEEANMAWTQIKVGGESRWQPGTRAAFANGEDEIISSRVYFNKAIAYVTLGTPSREVLAASGDPLEILFVDHPNELVTGKPARIRVFGNGEPRRGQKVELHAEGGAGHDEPMSVCTTDQAGTCQFTLPTKGRYLLIASAEGRHENGSETDGFSNSVSVIVAAREATQ